MKIALDKQNKTTIKGIGNKKPTVNKTYRFWQTKKNPLYFQSISQKKESEKLKKELEEMLKKTNSIDPIRAFLEITLKKKIDLAPTNNQLQLPKMTKYKKTLKEYQGAPGLDVGLGGGDNVKSHVKFQEAIRNILNNKKVNH